MAEVKKTGTKIAEREALNAAGESQSDYTEAVRAQYTYLPSGKVITWDFAHIPEPVERAFAIEGFLNKVGHAANVKNKADYKGYSVEQMNKVVDAELDAFLENAIEGGWTNREGGNEINLAAVLEAFAELRGATVEQARAAWETYSDDNKTRVRTNPKIKAIIAQKRADKAAKLAGEAGGDELPAL